MIHYSECPSCNSRDIIEKSTVKDFSVSGETFHLMNCNHCGLVFTQDIPSKDDIQKYYRDEQYISHSDTSKGIVNKLYHLVRARTLRKKRNLVKKYSQRNKGNILDIGSGTGSFLKEMKSSDWEITGIEPDSVARENSLKFNGIEALEPSFFNQLSENSFDAITMWHVLEHVHQLKQQMAQLGRVIKDKGIIFIAVPNNSSFDAKYYGTYWAAWDVPRHLYHFIPESMKHLCSETGFEIIDILPMWYDSFYVSMLSEKYRSGKTKIIRPFFIGLRSNMIALFNSQRCSSLIYIMRKAPEK